MAANPLAAKKSSKKGAANPLFEKKPKNFGVGQALPVKQDLSRFVKWPKYVRLQRQKRILMKRLKVPPSIAQFNKALDKNVAETLFNLLAKYAPEDKTEKKERLMAEAEAAAAGGGADKKKPMVVKYGINHVTQLVEAGKAQLVVIAHDVDPIEIVVWLPTLCKKMNVPYCIVKGKARLGSVVHTKTATALCLTGVKQEDQREFGKIVETCRGKFNDVKRIAWGGGIMGAKNQYKMKMRAKAVAKELAQRQEIV